ncbi:MAG: disulfide bond formation protein B [Gammaproteobacteria bacterium]
MINMQSIRLFYILIFLTCVSLLGFGLYLEHVKGLEPCPLCVFQRVAYIAIAIISLIATIHGPGKIFTWIYSSLIDIAALCGAGVAGRQIWLQHLPADQVPECGPGLEYMLEAFPLGEALNMILSGSGECAEVQWRFIGLSIAEWSLFCFVIFIILSLTSILYAKRAM